MAITRANIDEVNFLSRGSIAQLLAEDHHSRVECSSPVGPTLGLARCFLWSSGSRAAGTLLCVASPRTDLVVVEVRCLYYDACGGVDSDNKCVAFVCPFVRICVCNLSSRSTDLLLS